MKALLLIAHGSRRKQSNDEVFLLAEKLGETCKQQYSIVQAAFLEIAEILIPEGIKRCVDQGATTVIVLPYFLNSGRHVVEDIPSIVNEARRNHPDVDIRIAPHLGASDAILDLLKASADLTDQE